MHTSWNDTRTCQRKILAQTDDHTSSTYYYYYFNESYIYCRLLLPWSLVRTFVFWVRPTTSGPLIKAHDEVLLRLAVAIEVRAERRKPAAIRYTYHRRDTVFVAKVMKDLFVDTSRASSKHVCSKHTEWVKGIDGCLNGRHKSVSKRIKLKFGTEGAGEHASRASTFHSTNLPEYKVRNEKLEISTYGGRLLIKGVSPPPFFLPYTVFFLMKTGLFAK